MDLYSIEDKDLFGLELVSTTEPITNGSFTVATNVVGDNFEFNVDDVIRMSDNIIGVNDESGTCYIIGDKEEIDGVISLIETIKHIRSEANA